MDREGGGASSSACKCASSRESQSDGGDLGGIDERFARSPANEGASVILVDGKRCIIRNLPLFRRLPLQLDGRKWKGLGSVTASVG